jgi:hypothetical protein
MWGRWVDFWDRKEHPAALAVVRICLGVVMLYDMLHIWALGLVDQMFVVKAAGGLGSPMRGVDAPLLYELLPATAATGHAHHIAMVVVSAMLALGLFSRTSAALLLVLSVQFAHTLPIADRGIEMLVRNVLMILMFSGCGGCWSLDALRKGDVAARGVAVGAWARQLLVLQLVVMYFTAGVQKVGLLWTPFGEFAALYVILQDPAIARFDFGWLARQPYYLLTQLGTAVTVVFQWTYPVVPLLLYYRATPDKPGRLRAISNRYHLELIWIGLGMVFHLSLAVTAELGIFPWAMMALYPAFWDPGGAALLSESEGAS